VEVREVVVGAEPRDPPRELDAGGGGLREDVEAVGEDVAVPFSAELPRDQRELLVLPGDARELVGLGLVDVVGA
jgi:hypothetical protein